MVAHLLLRVQKKNPLERRRIITYLTTIIPSTDADKKEWIDEKYENMKATNRLSMCLHMQPTFSYSILKVLGL